MLSKKLQSKKIVINCTKKKLVVAPESIKTVKSQNNALWEEVKLLREKIEDKMSNLDAYYAAKEEDIKKKCVAKERTHEETAEGLKMNLK